jgi:hypothetical protein
MIAIETDGTVDFDKMREATRAVLKSRDESLNEYCSVLTLYHFIIGPQGKYSKEVKV